MAEERLQNIIARAGFASRRKASALVEAGRVTVDGVTVTRACERFDPERVQICIDGRPLPPPERRLTIVLNKPAGVLSTMSDPFGGKTVADLVRGVPARVVPVGRLDKDSEGLLLMSSDGDLVNRLTHPRFGHEKTYVVEVAGRWSDEKLATLRSALQMPDGYVIRPTPVKVLKPAERNVTTLEFRLREGRKRQIRYMCSAAHLVVLSLKRVAVGSFRLPENLPPGAWRELAKEELDGLFR